MKWFTLREYLSLISERRFAYQGPDIKKFAEDLGDGVRFWMTTIVGLLILGVLASPFGIKATNAAVPAIFAGGCLMFMMLCGMAGAFFTQGFSPCAILVLAMKHVRK